MEKSGRRDSVAALAQIRFIIKEARERRSEADVNVRPTVFENSPNTGSVFELRLSDPTCTEIENPATILARPTSIVICS